MPLNALQTLEISGNGSESESAVTVTNNQDTTISQTNETKAETNVAVDANSGSNSISDSSGAKQHIETGDVTVSETVDNSLNHAEVEQSTCCQSSTEVEVKNNGSGSSNAVQVTQSTQTSVQASQQAAVRNSISSQTNTGENHVSGGHSLSLVKTGEITETVTVTNQVNHALIRTGSGNPKNVSVTVKGNGSNSENSVSLSHDASVIIWISNVSTIDNEVEGDSETGGNSILENLGDVLIQTGAINSSVVVDTVANVSTVAVDNCCQKSGLPLPDEDKPPSGEEEKPPDNNDEEEQKPEENDKENNPSSPSTPPTNLPQTETKSGSSTGNGTSDSGRGGVLGTSNRVLGASDYRVLPATASRDFILMLIANIFTFMLGCYLRLHSGRAPAYAA